MTPAVTLLIPCYNAAAFLPRLLADVRAMQPGFAAVLAYDDGSTDHTVAVARALGVDILTPNANSGVATARNRLAAAATTEWIHFHDADDRIAPDFLQHLGPLTAQADVVSCDADWINDSDGALQTAWRYDPAALAAQPHRYLLQHALGLNNSLIRRICWQAVGGCDVRLAIWEDADVHIRMARAGARWAHVAAVLTWSLRRPESFSHDLLRGWRCRLQALQQYATLADVDAVRDVLDAQAELAATQLLSLGDTRSAAAALRLCRALGGRAPRSGHPLLRWLRPLLSDLTLLRLQHLWRRRA